MQNLARASLAMERVFRDGYQSQLAAISGSVSTGVVASLAVPVR